VNVEVNKLHISPGHPKTLLISHCLKKCLETLMLSTAAQPLILSLSSAINAVLLMGGGSVG
jgi:hypothetical protein